MYISTKTLKRDTSDIPRIGHLQRCRWFLRGNTFCHPATPHIHHRSATFFLSASWNHLLITGSGWAVSSAWYRNYLRCSNYYYNNATDHVELKTRNWIQRITFAIESNAAHIGYNLRQRYDTIQSLHSKNDRTCVRTKSLWKRKTEKNDVNEAGLEGRNANLNLPKITNNDL